MEEIYNQTVINPIGLGLLITLSVLLLIIKRKNVLLPIIIIICFIPSAQRITIFGFDFTFLRILILFGWVRVYFRKEMTNFTWSKLDKLIIIWAIITSLVYIIRRGTFIGAANRFGFLIDSIGSYFLFRFLVKDIKDVEKLIKQFILISLPIFVFFVIEKETGHNMFSIFGGVPANTIIRSGKLRVQGAFSHAILAGCFWASLLPLFISNYWNEKYNKITLTIVIILTLVIVWFTNSSTPITGVIVGIFGFITYFYRQRIKIIIISFILILIALQIKMHHPIWYTIQLVDLSGGSDSWHRYYLIDQAVKHFWEWWLLGTIDTSHWGYELYDVTNQYVLEAVDGGLISLILFIVIIYISFQYVGKINKYYENNNDKYHSVLAWMLGSSLLVHVFSFIGVSYFGQIVMLWYLLLAIISSLYTNVKLSIEKYNEIKL